MLQKTKNKSRSGEQGPSSYYEDGRSWDYDRYGRMKSSRNRAWIVAAASAAIAGLCLLALLMLLPLKQFEPYVITVDQSSGYVEMTRGLQPGDLSQDEAITESFLVRYVTAREGYMPALTETNYNKVTLWSERDALVEYQTIFNRKNDANPVKKYGTSTNVAVGIKSVQFLNDRTAAVRFLRTETRHSRSAQSHWVATINFRYVEKPSSMKERYINPLGFQVGSYRIDQESLGE